MDKFDVAQRYVGVASSQTRLVCCVSPDGQFIASPSEDGLLYAHTILSRFIHFLSPLPRFFFSIFQVVFMSSFISLSNVLKMWHSLLSFLSISVTDTFGDLKQLNESPLMPFLSFPFRFGKLSEEFEVLLVDLNNKRVFFLSKVQVFSSSHFFLNILFFFCVSVDDISLYFSHFFFSFSLCLMRRRMKNCL